MEKSISRVLYQAGDLQLISYMKMPLVTFNEVYSTVKLQGTPIIIMKKIAKTKDPSNQYIITIENIYDVVEWVNTMVSWFYKKEYSQMFLVDEVGMIILNTEMSSYHTDTYRRLDSDPGLRGYPTVVKINSASMPEKGVNIIINRIENAVQINLSQLKKLLSTLVNYSFQGEMTLFLNTLMYYKLNNAVKKEGETYAANYPNTQSIPSSKIKRLPKWE